MGNLSHIAAIGVKSMIKLENSRNEMLNMQGKRCSTIVYYV